MNERLFYKPKAYLIVEVAVNWQFLNSANHRRGQQETSPCFFIDTNVYLYALTWNTELQA
ncbi:hypothetical protein [Nostoc sp. ChiVER01]|uniref:hypothetical protein n=1 Tax=Nostoc sp. ChiVER01 TaxID=3075382 RepID=UPI002AD26389|nr:hypothetical protein [Nostoc sp. ChiVER01]MDZ8223556.1 hypothetical protein [Nostoc sp. ChiVER01]